MIGAERERTVIKRERVEQWFEDNFVGNACIMCTQLWTRRPCRSLSIAETHGKTVRYVVVECSECGHTLFYNAETIGVLGPKE